MQGLTDVVGWALPPLLGLLAPDLREVLQGSIRSNLTGSEDPLCVWMASMRPRLSGTVGWISFQIQLNQCLPRRGCDFLPIHRQLLSQGLYPRLAPSAFVRPLHSHLECPFSVRYRAKVTDPYKDENRRLSPSECFGVYHHLQDLHQDPAMESKLCGLL